MPYTWKLSREKNFGEFHRFCSATKVFSANVLGLGTRGVLMISLLLIEKINLQDIYRPP